LRRKVLSPFAQLGREDGSSSANHALVDREQSRPAVEVGLDAMEQIGSGRHAPRLRGQQVLGLERHDIVGAKGSSALGVEQPAPRAGDRVGSRAALSRAI